MAGVNRGAAIVAATVSAPRSRSTHASAAPNAHPGLIGKTAAAHERVRAFAPAVPRGETADRSNSANPAVREINCP